MAGGDVEISVRRGNGVSCLNMRTAGELLGTRRREQSSSSLLTG